MCHQEQLPTSADCYSALNMPTTSAQMFKCIIMVHTFMIMFTSRQSQCNPQENFSLEFWWYSSCLVTFSTLPETALLFQGTPLCMVSQQSPVWWFWTLSSHVYSICTAWKVISFFSFLSQEIIPGEMGGLFFGLFNSVHMFAWVGECVCVIDHGWLMNINNPADSIR